MESSIVSLVEEVRKMAGLGLGLTQVHKPSWVRVSGNPSTSETIEFSCTLNKTQHTGRRFLLCVEIVSMM